MIALTARLNERDEQIMTLQVRPQHSRTQWLSYIIARAAVERMAA